MEQFPNNSNAYKNAQKVVEKKEEKVVQKVITGTATKRKKTLLNKMTDAFIAEDISNVKQHIIEDVVIPRIKQTLADVGCNTINMLFLGSAAPKSSVFGGSSVISYKGGNINYSGISSGKTPAKSNIPTYDEIVLQTRTDAERVLDDLKAMIERFGEATINDLYELVDLPGESTYNNYGWKSLRGADIGAVRDGYLLKMPRAILLK